MSMRKRVLVTGGTGFPGPLLGWQSDVRLAQDLPQIITYFRNLIDEGLAG